MKAYAETGSSEARKSVGRNRQPAREACSSRRPGWPQILWRSGPRGSDLRQRGSWQAAWDSLPVFFNVARASLACRVLALTSYPSKNMRPCARIEAKLTPFRGTIERLKLALLLQKSCSPRLALT